MNAVLEEVLAAYGSETGELLTAASLNDEQRERLRNYVVEGIRDTDASYADPGFAQHFRDHVARGPICLRLVFVLEDHATMKDCDNMAKGLLDAFEGFLYENDRQVEHLDTSRVQRAPGSDGYIIVRCASTRLNDHGDVIAPRHATLAWMSKESLDISRFLQRPTTYESSRPEGAQ